MFVPITLAQLIKSDLNRNQVSLHAMNHVLVRPLSQHLLLMRILNIIEVLLSVV